MLLYTWFKAEMGADVTLIVDCNLPSNLQSIFRHWELTSREQVPSLVPVWFLCVVTKVCSVHRNRFWWATNSKQQLVGFFSLKLSLLCFQELHIFKKGCFKENCYLFSNFLVALFSRIPHLKNCFKGSVDSYLTFSDLSFGCFCFLLVGINCRRQWASMCHFHTCALGIVVVWVRGPQCPSRERDFLVRGEGLGGVTLSEEECH